MTDSQENEVNPYAYLDRNEFTSERFKIEIRGLPKFYGIGELKKLLNEKLKLNSTKIKPPARRSAWIYVCFRSEEDRQQAVLVLQGYKWKGNKLKVEIARPAADPLVQKRKLDNEALSTDSQVCNHISDSASLEETLKLSTIPNWNVAYNVQLEKKAAFIKDSLIKYGNNIRNLNPDLSSWLATTKSENGGLPCQFQAIRPSPLLDEYRNKCEFTIGLNPVTGKPTVGFRLCSYAQGNTSVGPVEGLRHIPARMKQSAKIFEQYVCTSGLEIFSPETQTGYWRQLTARLAQSGELMLIIGIHPQQLSSEELINVKQKLKDFFSEGDGKACNVTSLYFQLIQKRKPGLDSSPVDHLLGETHIYENVLGVKLRISPMSFFQTNTLGMEVLYNAVADVASVDKDTTLLDICCGIGSIGLCLAKRCGQVLGIEIVPEAISDAKINASINGIENCEFFVGKAEDILSAVIGRSTKKNIVAIVDPPRAGLHNRAVIHLRRCEKISKLVFLACNPTAAMKNFMELVRPPSKTYHGSPFIPVSAVPVDMFPHTHHCELIVFFKRSEM